MESQMVFAENGDGAALHQTLVDDLKQKGLIHSPHVEAAFRAVPRHLFLPDMPLADVYSDRAIVTKQDGNGQWISSSSQPAIMAIMLEQLELEPGHKVLEIGAGTGYNAALLAHLVGPAGHVVTLDIDEDIVDAARAHLAAAGYGHVEVVRGDGGHGYLAQAPYDRIILTVGAADILPAWREQLRLGGRLVLPLEVVVKGWQKAIVFEQQDNYLVSRSIHECGFMPLRGAFAAPSETRTQLGPDPDVFLLGDTAPPVAAQVVYDWLSGPYKDWETGVDVKLGHIFRGLRLWLALHEPTLSALIASGDMVERGLVPPLFGYGGEWRSITTAVTLSGSGMAALMRPPGQSVPLADLNALFADDTPFQLFVRQFGTDDAPACRLVEQIRAWDAAGRPSSDDLTIRAYPKDSHYEPSQQEFVVEKEWTRLVLAWEQSGAA